MISHISKSGIFHYPTQVVKWSRQMMTLKMIMFPSSCNDNNMTDIHRYYNLSETSKVYIANYNRSWFIVLNF